MRRQRKKHQEACERIIPVRIENTKKFLKILHFSLEKKYELIYTVIACEKGDEAGSCWAIR